MMALLEYAQASRPLEWGFNDCALFCAGWVHEKTGIDPGHGLRGSYSTAEEANAIVDRAGGMEAFIGGRLRLYGGFDRTDARQDGDIGLIEWPTGLAIEAVTTKIVPAIAWGPLWIAQAARGAVIKQMKWTGVAWRIQ